jgi:DNA-directed RNA polymerase specialized sigma24 family protein
MVATKDAGENGIPLLLAGSEEQMADGLALIERLLRQRLCRWIRRRFPGMSVDDLGDAWGSTLVCVLQSIRGRRLPADRPVTPWLRKIMYARAADQTRRKTRQEEILKAARRIRRPGPQRHEVPPAEASREEFMESIGAAIKALPRSQRIVFEAFVACFPETQNMETLRMQVSRVTQREQTLSSVKRALQEGRYKVREFLKSKGFVPGAGAIA